MIFLQLSQQLQSLRTLLSIISNQQYTHKIAHLGNASVGGHARHIIELLQCAINGYHTGTVDYIKRSRDIRLETDKLFAGSVIQKIESDGKMPDKQLFIKVEQMGSPHEIFPVNTTYFREVIYNTEHAIHHLALIKVALIEMKLDIVSNDFGMAYSTIQYKASLNNACV